MPGALNVLVTVQSPHGVPSPPSPSQPLAQRNEPSSATTLSEKSVTISGYLTNVTDSPTLIVNEPGEKQTVLFAQTSITTTWLEASAGIAQRSSKASDQVILRMFVSSHCPEWRAALPPRIPRDRSCDARGGRRFHGQLKPTG